MRLRHPRFASFRQLGRSLWRDLQRLAPPQFSGELNCFHTESVSLGRKPVKLAVAGEKLPPAAIRSTA